MVSQISRTNQIFGFGITVELATSDLGTTDISVQPTFYLGPCTFAISAMHFTSAEPISLQPTLATSDIFFQSQKVFIYYIFVATTDIFMQKRLVREREINKTSIATTFKCC